MALLFEQAYFSLDIGPAKTGPTGPVAPALCTTYKQQDTRCNCLEISVHVGIDTITGNYELRLAINLWLTVTIQHNVCLYGGSDCTKIIR